MNEYSNTIHRYDSLLYESRPASLNELLNNKYNNIHNELYNDALNKYIYEIIEKYINYDFIYEFYQKISGLENLDNEEINFDTFWSHYEKIYKLKEYNDIIKNTLDILSIDHKLCLKLLYNITVEKLNEVKSKFIEYGENEDGEIISIIDGLSKISDISDFRFAYSENVKFISLELSPNVITIDNNNIINLSNYLIGSEEIDYENDNNSTNNEHNKYIIICESENGIRIGYNRLGEWILIVDDNTKFRNIKNISNIKNHINKYINIKSKNIHYLYKDIICKLYKKYHKIVEIKQSEYWMPSSIFIINKFAPFSKITVDLSKYWNSSQNNENSKLEDLKITKDPIKDSELIELNYISGKAKIQSRTEDIIYEVPFKYLDENTNVSEDMILSNSFITKYNEL